MSRETTAIQQSCDIANRCTKRGKVLRTVQERYLRVDLPCFSPLCSAANCRASPSAGNDSTWLSDTPAVGSYLLPDLDVLASQMDVLEYDKWVGLSDIIILETVLEQLKAQDLGLYNRLYQLIKKAEKRVVVFANEHHSQTYSRKQPNETWRERHQRVTRLAVKWYMQHLNGAVRIQLLTNNADQADIAKEEGLEASTIAEYIEQAVEDHPSLADLLSTTEAMVKEISASTMTVAKRSSFKYREHLPMSAISRGVQKGTFFQGTIRCNRENWLECYVMVFDTSSTSKDPKKRTKIPIRISGREDINRAMDGDVVAIEILPKDQWLKDSESNNSTKSASSSVSDDVIVDDTNDEKDSERVVPPTIADEVMSSTEAELTSTESAVTGAKPTGRVVGILRRNWRKYCGSIELKDEAHEPAPGAQVSCYVIPVDRKVPKIRIVTRQYDHLKDKRIIVTIDGWPTDSRFPQGHYVATLGEIGDKSVETEVLLVEFDIRKSEFSEKVMQCLPPEDWSITPENSKNRRDLRDVPVMSIDPPNCKDIDDALHCVELPNGNLQVGVHIADVTYFVEAGSPLDLEAMERGTSTYLVERRLDMLPGLLTTQLCSLRSGEDHFAFSVVWEMTRDGEVVSVEFFKSIIHSIASLSYGEAQVMLDDKNDSSVPSTAIKHLFRLSQIFKQRRMSMGALTLASPEVKFVLDTETQNPLDVNMYTLRQTNSLVEEFMLFANITVAKKILRHFPSFSCLRNHPAPSKSQFTELIDVAKSVGIEIRISTSKELAESLDKATKADNPYLNKMIRILTTRCMKPAAYFCSGELSSQEFHHYGLAAPIYTHFTSPIRRYADVIVHRLLAACLGISPLPEMIESKDKLNDVCQNLNARHLNAQLAGRASVNLHTLVYFDQRPTTTDGVVLRVKPNGIGVLLMRFGIEGRIMLVSKEEEENGESKWVLDEKKHTLTSKDDTSVQLRVFDKVKVHVKVEMTRGNRKELKMELVEPRIPGQNQQILMDDVDSKESKRRKAKNGTPKRRNNK